MTKWTKSSIHSIFLLAVIALPCVAASAQTDIAASLYGAFTPSTNGNGTAQSPSNSAGGLLEFRHISHPLIGYEVTYSYNRDNQVYRYSFTQPCPTGGCTVAAVSANAHEVSGDWVVSMHAANLRPFALVGVGALFNEPAGNQSFTNSVTRPVYIYGAGFDWGLLPHLGLRVQYRGDLYRAPNLTRVFTSTNAFTNTAEPMVGIYFKL